MSEIHTLSPGQMMGLGSLLLGGEPPAGAVDFTVLDYREAAPCWSLIHHRGWARGGWRQTILARGRDRGTRRRIRAITDRRLPGVVLIPTDVAGVRTSDIIGSLFGVRDTVSVFCTSDGTFLHDGLPLSTDERDYFSSRESAVITVHGAGERRFEGAELPLRLPLRLPSPGGAQPVVGVTGGAGLPGQIWYTLGGVREGNLEIDVTPRPDGDRWNIHYRDDAGNRQSMRRATGPAPRAIRRPLDRLAVIFDRTCPDAAAWSAARSLTLRGLLDDPRAAELNRGLRDGLAAALSKILGPLAIPVDVWWVSGDAVVAAGSAPASETAALLDDAGWAPGEGIWDPLEEGLESALDSLDIDGLDPHGSVAVVIVGNSPPRPALDRADPLSEIARFPGFPTRVPHTSAGWRIQLERATSAGVPVRYLFLTHPEHAEDDAAAHAGFRALRETITRALSRSLPLDAAAATREGLHAGLRTVMEAFSTPADAPEGVVIRDEARMR